jgi:hypothetical protein
MDKPPRRSFEEIEAKRLRLVDPSGTIRMSVSGKPVHDPLFRGEQLVKQERMAAGFIFFTEEGTECGGFLFGGQTKGGTPRSDTSFTLDAYEQDQVVKISCSSRGDKRSYGITWWDRPYTPLRDLVESTVGWRKWTFLVRLLLDSRWRRRMNEEHAIRLFLGRRADEVGMFLNDSKGNPRIRMIVDANDNPRMEFLDGGGKVIYKLPPG